MVALDDFCFLRLDVRAADGDIDDTSDGKLKLDESDLVSCELSSAVSIVSWLAEGGKIDAEVEPRRDDGSVESSV
jgi:hypothetical protein